MVDDVVVVKEKPSAPKCKTCGEEMRFMWVKKQARWFCGKCNKWNLADMISTMGFQERLDSGKL